MPHILIIDDDEDIRDLLRITLESEGYKVSLAENGKTGLKRFYENPPDLIITDIFMPEKDGIETIIQLKKEYPNIRIFAISGGGLAMDYNYLNYAKKFGAVSVFRKPVKLSDIIENVRQIFQK